MHCKKCDGLLRNDRGTERYTCECAADPASHRATRFMHALCATKPATDSQSRGIPIKMYAPIVPFQNATRRECEYENVIKNSTCHRMLKDGRLRTYSLSRARYIRKRSKVGFALPQDANVTNVRWLNGERVTTLKMSDFPITFRKIASQSFADDISRRLFSLS